MASNRGKAINGGADNCARSHIFIKAGGSWTSWTSGVIGLLNKAGGVIGSVDMGLNSVDNGRAFNGKGHSEARRGSRKFGLANRSKKFSIDLPRGL